MTMAKLLTRSTAQSVYLRGWNLLVSRAGADDVTVTLPNGQALHLPQETRRRLFFRVFQP